MVKSCLFIVYSRGNNGGFCLFNFGRYFTFLDVHVQLHNAHTVKAVSLPVNNFGES